MALKREAQLGGSVRCAGLGITTQRLGGLLTEVLDAHATFDRPHREALLIREDRNASAGDKRVAG